MDSNDIVEYGRTKEVRNNYTIGYGVEVNPERQESNFTTKLIWYWKANINIGINTSSES